MCHVYSTNDIILEQVLSVKTVYVTFLQHKNRSDYSMKTYWQTHIYCTIMRGVGFEQSDYRCAVWNVKMSYHGAILTTLILDVPESVTAGYLWLQGLRGPWEEPGLHHATPWHNETRVWRVRVWEVCISIWHLGFWLFMAVYRWNGACVHIAACVC